MNNKDWNKEKKREWGSWSNKNLSEKKRKISSYEENKKRRNRNIHRLREQGCNSWITKLNLKLKKSMIKKCKMNLNHTRTIRLSRRYKNKKAKTQLISSQSNKKLISWLNFQKCSKVNSVLLKGLLYSSTKSLTKSSFLTEVCSSPKKAWESKWEYWRRFFQVGLESRHTRRENWSSSTNI